MLSDLDRGMEARRIESLIVRGTSTVGNPELAYVAGVSLVRGGIFVKRRSHDPTLIVSNLDIGTAKHGRVRRVRTYSEYGLDKLLQKHEPNEARVRFYQNIVRQEGLRGPLSIMGTNEVSSLLRLIDTLRRRGVKVVGQQAPTVLDAARETKDSREIAMLADVGVRTCSVVRKTVEFLRKCRVSGSRVIYKSRPLSVGTVKALIRRLLSEKDLVAPEGTIFAPGRKSSDPHYMGEEKAVVRAREPIVFDIFPHGPHGYFSDVTRTYCFGSPSDKVKMMYDAVVQAQSEALDLVKEGASGKAVDTHICKVFERLGYLTLRDFLKGNKAASTRGYNHSLGHGVGLTIGERPSLSIYVDDPLKKAAVVTVEPGLYEPRHGGVRIEDVVVIGSPSKNLTPLGKDLEL